MNFSLSGQGTAGDSLRRAKIVATLGPASSNETTFRELLRAGLDVARLNFSHGTLPEKLNKRLSETGLQSTHGGCSQAGVGNYFRLGAFARVSLQKKG
jgi:hypothetical protein